MAADGIVAVAAGAIGVMGAGSGLVVATAGLVGFVGCFTVSDTGAVSGLVPKRALALGSGFLGSGAAAGIMVL